MASPKMKGNPVHTITGLRNPCCIALSGDDQLIVTELGGHCVTVLDKHGKKIKSFGNEGSDDVQFQDPTGIAITPDNHILVVDQNNACIQKFTMDGRFVAEVGSKGRGQLQFDYPMNIHVHPSGKVLVADSYNHRIQVLNPDLSFSHSFGSRGSQPGQFQLPFDVSTDDEGMVYVSDNDNHRIQKFTLKGEFVAQFKGEMKSPTGIAIDENNILYVSNDHCMSMFDTNGKSLGTFGKKGSGDDEFCFPFGVLVDKSGKLYVCDSSNNRIVVYS